MFLAERVQKCRQCLTGRAMIRHAEQLCRHVLATGFAFFPQMGIISHFNPPDNLNIIGPLQGYSPQPGTFVSMLNWMRDSVIRAVKGLKPEELDFLMDPKSQSHWGND